ncbi:MAG TPA: carbohydrate ABC transporter permease [Solirubrobacteraceae bacterium]|nr:carbohydrate ABC transporter permease [Solirubrobacteraceae bacterium]
MRRLPVSFSTAVGFLIVAVYLFPIYWMVTGSIKSQDDLFASPPQLIPIHPQFSTWSQEILHKPEVLEYIRNTFIVATGTMVLALVLAAPAAYALANFHMRGKSLIMLFCLSSLMLPAIMLATPLFVIFSRVHLTNSLLGLILADTTLALPYAIVLLRPTFASIPKDLAEAAQIDGSSSFGAFVRIVLPLARPGLATVGVLSFLWGWGDLVFALTLTSDESKRVVTTGLANFFGAFATDWAGAMAFCSLAMLPPLLVFVFAQRQVIAGLTTGGTKG